MSISTVILTFNSAETIGATIKSAQCVSDDIHIVDSYSTDATCDIARMLGATVTQHPFEHYGAQRNWAIDNLPLRHEWQLHLDADERLSDPLITEINAIHTSGFPDDVDGYFLPRLMLFMGRPIRHGGLYPTWHMRLFRRGKGRCESRRYDQHFRLTGNGRQFQHPMIDDIRLSLSEWTQRHNRWSDLEVAELLQPGSKAEIIAGHMAGNPIERKRALRGWYNRAPLFFRAFALFFYRYVIRFGFLDGKTGFIFYVLQTFWFRFLIDAKLYEYRLKQTKK